MRFVYIILLALLPLSSSAQMRLDYFLTEAAKSRMLGQWSKATELYRHCLDIDSCSAEALYQLGRIHFYLRQDSVGLDYLQRAVDRDPDNTYYIEPLVAILLRQGCDEEALPLLEHISRLQTKRSDILYHLANMYAKFDRLEDAISIYNRLEVLEGKMSRLSNEKFSLYMQMGDSISAFAELQSLCDEYPAELSYQIDMGYCYQQLDDFESAMEIYEQVRKIDPQNTSLQMAMLDYYIMQGMDSLYEATRDSILYSVETDAGKRIVLLQQMIQRMSADSVEVVHIIERFERVVALDSSNVELLTMYAAFLNYTQKSHDRLREIMLQVLVVEPDNEMATQWLLQYYAERRDYFSLEEICRRGINYHPNELVYPYFLGMILYDSGHYEEALTVLDKGLRQRSENTRLVLISETFTIKGDVYFKMDRYEDAFLEYDSALVYNKDNILCLNNYAYYLSLHNEDLDKAEEMSYRTIKVEPNNRTYLDTYAWILFMQNKFEDAQKYMDIVVPRDSSEHFLMTDLYTSTAILEHAGDVAWMNGDMERAVYLWQLAVKRADDELTPVLMKKAKKKKYFKKK